MKNSNFFRFRCLGDLTIWSRTATEIEVFVPKSAVDPVGQRLKGENIKYEVFAADYQRVIDEENPPQEEIARVQRRNGMKSVRKHSDEHDFSSFCELSAQILKCWVVVHST